MVGTECLKLEKENGKVFNCDDMAQVKGEICGISRRQMFNKSLLQQLYIEEDNPFTLMAIIKAPDIKWH